MLFLIRFLLFMTISHFIQTKLRLSLELAVTFWRTTLNAGLKLHDTDYWYLCLRFLLFYNYQIWLTPTATWLATLAQLGSCRPGQIILTVIAGKPTDGAFLPWVQPTILLRRILTFLLLDCSTGNLLHLLFDYFTAAYSKALLGSIEVFYDDHRTAILAPDGSYHLFRFRSDSVACWLDKRCQVLLVMMHQGHGVLWHLDCMLHSSLQVLMDTALVRWQTEARVRCILDDSDLTRPSQQALACFYVLHAWHEISHRKTGRGYRMGYTSMLTIENILARAARLVGLSPSFCLPWWMLRLVDIAAFVCITLE